MTGLRDWNHMDILCGIYIKETRVMYWPMATQHIIIGLSGGLLTVSVKQPLETRTAFFVKMKYMKLL